MLPARYRFSLVPGVSTTACCPRFIHMHPTFGLRFGPPKFGRHRLSWAATKNGTHTMPDQNDPTSAPDGLPSTAAPIALAADAEQTKASDLSVSVPGYEILGEVGRGGMGVVYRAHDPAVNRDVAVKVLQDRYRASPMAIRRFVEEGQVTGQLQHPGVPAVHQIGR